MKNENKGERLLSESKAAIYAGVTVATLRKHRLKGKIIPAIQVTGLCLYDGESVKRHFDHDPIYQASKLIRETLNTVSKGKAESQTA